MSGTEHIDLGTATDEHLYLLAREGTEIATNILYKRYVSVAREVLPWGLTDNDRTQIVSGALMRVLKGDSYDVARPLRPYLTMVIRNIARDQGRRRKRLRDHEKSLDALMDKRGYLPVDPDTANFAEASGAIGESIRALIDDWEHSPVWSHRRHQWAAVLRQLLAGHSNRETAAVLGLDLRSVQNIVDKHIKPALSPLCDEPPGASR
jgi:DNA-directed RNA polymerase specialized sigma24 family protein